MFELGVRAKIVSFIACVALFFGVTWGFNFHCCIIILLTFLKDYIKFTVRDLPLPSFVNYVNSCI